MSDRGNSVVCSTQNQCISEAARKDIAIAKRSSLKRRKSQMGELFKRDSQTAQYHYSPGVKKLNLNRRNTSYFANKGIPVAVDWE